MKNSILKFSIFGLLTFGLTGCKSDGDSEAPKVNVALNKTATQNTIYFGQTPASIAVDGIREGIYPQLASTAGSTTTDYWEVDLGSNHTINSISIYNRDECCQNRLSKMYVMISDTPFPPLATNLAGALNEADYIYQLPLYVTGDEFIPNIPNVVGRYVRLQKSGVNPGGDIINIAEVEVYGTPVP